MWIMGTGELKWPLRVTSHSTFRLSCSSDFHWYSRRGELLFSCGIDLPVWQFRQKSHDQQSMLTTFPQCILKPGIPRMLSCILFTLYHWHKLRCGFLTNILSIISCDLVSHYQINRPTRRLSFLVFVKSKLICVEFELLPNFDFWKG